MKLANHMLLNSKPINVVRIALALLGIFVLFSLPREQYPNVPLHYVHIVVAYPGASAEEIEKEITQKIEKKTKKLTDIKSVTSSISNGLSFTRVTYDQSLSSQDFTSDYLELQSSINNISIPDGALTPVVDSFTYFDFLPIVDVIVYADDGVDIDELMTTSKRIKSNLEINESVSNISSVGLIEKKILISLDKDELEKNNISLAEINQAIKEQNISIPSGNLETEKYVINVKTGNDIKEIQELGDILIRSYPNTIYLDDIATIKYFYDNQKELLRYNSLQSVNLQIYKTEASDSINLVNEIQNKLDKLEANLPEGLHFALFADTTEGIKNSINVLRSNALLGFILLCISLLIFLGWKPALISALEIPFTFATSFFVLKLLGITLNTSTLFALVLVLGMIVDHSIVILENIIRLRHFHNHNRLDSVIKGIEEVAFPVISSTLTTIGTFLPLAFMPGLIGKFLLPVPITITVTLIISTISALIIIPIHYMEMPGNERTHELKIFEYGRKILQVILHYILKFKIIICVLSLGLAGVSIFSFFNLPVSLYDTENQPFFFVDITLPIGSSIQESNKVMKELELSIRPLIDDGTIKSVITAIGNTNVDAQEGIRIDKPHNAQLQIEIPSQTPEYNALEHIDEIIKKVDAKINATTIDIEYTSKIRKQRTGPPVSSAVGFRILGDNLKDLELIGTRIKKELEPYSELFNINNNLEIAKPEITITINEKKATKHGYSTASLALLIRQWISDEKISTLFINNEQNDILVKLNDIPNNEKKDLSFMTFPDRNTGALIPFDQVASYTTKNVINNIHREDGKRVMKITADSTSRDRIKEINEHIQTLYNDTLSHEFPNTIFQIGGEFDEFANLLDDILILLIIGIFVVYVILVSEFKSYLQPLLIMLTILFTTIGVSFYLIATNSSLSITVLYSFVALVGVVVNGSIVLVSTANSIYKKNNITHTQAILQATLQRFKPIILTNFTTILGVLPTALGLNGKSPIWQPMASTIATGLIFSTITTLLIIPAFYALLPNKKRKKDFLHY